MKNRKHMIAVMLILALLCAVNIGASAERMAVSDGLRLSISTRETGEEEAAVETVETQDEEAEALEADEEAAVETAEAETEAAEETVEPASESAPESEEAKATLIRVRAKPSKSADVVAKISSEEVGSVTVEAVKGSWARILTADGVEGYLPAKYVRGMETAEKPETEKAKEPEAGKAEEPAEEKVAEEAPAEETPVEEAAAEEAPAEEPAPVEEDRTALVISAEEENAVALYAEPDAASEILAMIPEGATLGAKKIDGEWSLVAYEELTGYVRTGTIALYESEAKEDEKVRSIHIANSLAGATVVELGTVVTLTAELTGFEEDTYTLQWYEAVNGGEFEPMPGETGASISFPISYENVNNRWRISLTLENEPAAE